MFVEGFRLDRDSGQPVSTTYSKYRVRDVIEDWEEYEDRADQHEVETARAEKERQERYERERQEREARNREYEIDRNKQREERERIRQQLRNRLDFVLEGLVERGINRDSIRMNDMTGEATITLTELERWLKSLTKVECMTCHRELIMLEMPV